MTHKYKIPVRKHIMRLCQEMVELTKNTRVSCRELVIYCVKESSYKDVSFERLVAIKDNLLAEKRKLLIYLQGDVNEG